jgi:hypothetical protein
VKRRLLAGLLLLCLAAPSLLAVELLTPFLGVVYIPRPAAYAADSAPSIATNVLGAGLTFPLGGLFAFEPALSFYWTYHLWVEELDRALPAEIEHRTSFTLGFLLEAPFLLRLRLSERIGLGLGLGPAFHLRVGFRATGVEDSEDEDVSAELADINRFFYEKGRFFVPETLLRFQYRLTERMDFAFAAQAFWPVFNWWNGSDWFWDEGIFGGSLSVRYRLR